MSEKYEDYDYEEENNSGSNSGLLKKILIILLIVIAVIIIVYLLKGCKKEENSVDEPTVVESTKYEDALIESAKKYFDEYEDELPYTAGECVKVTLETLIGSNLIDGTIFTTCETTNTYVNVCMMSNGTRQYTPWLSCSDKKSEDEYGELKEGEISDVITNKTYVEFKFLPQIIGSTSKMLGKVEEMWKSDIKYSAYKTLSTTTYYRYRDKLFTWNVTTNHYYTSKGEVTNASNVTEYYTSSPSNNYQMYDNKATGYKWYTQEYDMKNGSKDVALSCPTEYPNVGAVIPVTMYQTAVETTKTSPNKFYKCASTANESDSKYIIYTPYECDKRPNVSQESLDEYKYQVGYIYSCAATDATGENILAKKVSGASSACYTKWNSATETKCDTTKDNCRSLTVNFKQCYKKVYYNSGSSNASDEKIYYTTAPAANTYKDESTKATVYKWYRTTTSTTTNYTATAPSGYASAKKTSNYKYSDWSDWSTKKVKASSGVTRSYETKTKVKLQQYLDGGETTWTDLSNDYVSLEEMLNIFTNNKYNVSSLDEINNNGEIRYQLKMYVRNKKEIN